MKANEVLSPSGEVVVDKKGVIHLEPFFRTLKKNISDAEEAYPKICAAYKNAKPAQKRKIRQIKKSIENYLEFFAPFRKQLDSIHV